ncbi:MAG: DedA family protein [Nocardioides sp.]|nr:DedA family protein [Nocardioides sp.]
MSGVRAGSVPGAGLRGLAGWTVDVITALGPVGVGLLVAAEKLFPPIPSEVVLPVAGYSAGAGRMSVLAAWTAATAGSLLGALALYWLGSALGRERVRAWGARIPLVDVADLDRSEDWFARHGGRAVLLGRCVPVVRSLVSVPAGVERMRLRTFIPYTVVGSGLWNAIFVGAGYQLGTRWQQVERWSGPLNRAVLVALGLLVVSFVVVRVRRGLRR